MALKACPRCASWRVQGSEDGTFLDRLLFSLHLRRYCCDDCNWKGIGRMKRTRNHAVRRYVRVVVILLIFVIAGSALGLHLADKGHRPKDIARTEPPVLNPVSDPRPAFKVIGNRDSKRYHLPGMVYYDRVEAYHRIEFSTEEEAIAAGYRKAPR